MTYENILVERKENYAVITLNRPQALNALNRALMAELDAAVDELAADGDIGAVILTGAGERAFAAGADITEFNSMPSASAAAGFSLLGQAVLNKIERLSKPIIAAINGFALGGGCELAMACDVRLAADTARLGQPEINLGIIPGYGGTQRLTRLVGRGMAKLLCLSGDHITAEKALRIGLVDKVVPAADLLAEAETLAAKLASKAPVAVAAIKQAINVGADGTLADGLAFEAAQFGLVFDTEDRVEGVNAFLEKRRPTWQGK
ncbi:MAG: enoyl-CoA hydratase/isomerase family protein [Anaerolineae bacterium]|nr:MAG: enoyl-CoA hydratase/isomerase family protein [Anaerolineae bacterium]